MRLEATHRRRTIALSVITDCQGQTSHLNEHAPYSLSEDNDLLKTGRGLALGFSGT